MKCIRNKDTGEVRRVTEVEAVNKVISGPWVYERKSAWKAQRRAGAKSE